MTTQIKGNDTSTFGGNVDVPQIVTDAPAFSVYQSSAQALSAGTWTLMDFDSTEYNVGSMFDTSTNTFQPTVAGYYFINCIFAPATSGSRAICEIRNESDVSVKRFSDIEGTNIRGLAGSALLYFNGTTNNIKMYGWTFSSGNTYNNSNRTVFQAVLVRAV